MWPGMANGCVSDNGQFVRKMRQGTRTNPPMMDKVVAHNIEGCRFLRIRKPRGDEWILERSWKSFDPLQNGQQARKAWVIIG